MRKLKDRSLKQEKQRNSIYSAFDQLDGQHPWQDAVPDGCILYPVRKLKEGKVMYFNFALAKEMGLINPSHPEKMNKELADKIIETFSIRIINEYDQKQNIKFHPSLIKTHEYMSTRYLQLQHKDKTGRTSGDGRSIWNGVFQHKETQWDVSSRGTGVTCLSPGAVEAGKPLRSGSTQFGYGCGMADVDELVGSAIMAEIFHNNNINTERMLTIIDLGKGCAIGVRAGKNLFRPAHMFSFLKQNDYKNLERSANFLIERQYKNNDWKFSTQHPKKWDLMLSEISESFAQFAAHLDRDYIFAWLDWDGDNVLANAGIIDYGSIRQFGLRHDEYRYDDVDRFSTTLNEQRKKARLIVQVFAQMINFLKTKNKKAVSTFKNHPEVKNFDSHFEYYLLDRFLTQIGLTRTRREWALNNQKNLVQNLYKDYSSLERAKTKKQTAKVADGVNRPAIYNMRFALHILPNEMLKSLEAGELQMMTPESFFKEIVADSAKGQDRKLTPYTRRRINSFQKQYWELLARTAKSEGMKAHLKNIVSRATEYNRTDRMTGDGLLHVVEQILKEYKSGARFESLQASIDLLIQNQSIGSEFKEDFGSNKLHLGRRSQQLLSTILSLVDGHRESI